MAFYICYLLKCRFWVCKPSMEKLFLLIIYNMAHILGVLKDIYFIYPTKNYLQPIKVNNRNTRKRCETCSKLQ